MQDIILCGPHIHKMKINKGYTQTNCALQTLDICLLGSKTLMIKRGISETEWIYLEV